MLERSAEPVASLYVHVPFCAQKCSYCAFYSEPSGGELINRYVSALIRELERIADGLKPQTVFFGGGTPSLLNLRQWEQILRAMERLDLLGAGEWTVECNPATVSLDKAKLWRSYGVNRISMGVQSLNAELLDRLGRIHSREMAFKSFDILRRAGFDNLNLDLMFAIPSQTMAMWDETLTEALAMQSEHLSTYEVIYEEDTPLYAQLKAGKVAEDEDLACEMYEEFVRRALAAEFKQYEVANFAKDAREPKVQNLQNESVFQTSETIPTPHSEILPSLACRHNVNYWRGGSFYGAGPSATSYVRGVRTKNWSNTQLYCEQLECGRSPAESREELAPLARRRNRRLRSADGRRLAVREFQTVTGFDLRKEWAEDMAKLVQQGWGQLEAERFRLTSQGLRFADSAAQMFLR